MFLKCERTGDKGVTKLTKRNSLKATCPNHVKMVAFMGSVFPILCDMLEGNYSITAATVDSDQIMPRF